MSGTESSLISVAGWIAPTRPPPVSAGLPSRGKHSCTVAHATVSVAPYPCATGAKIACDHSCVSLDRGAPPEMRRRMRSRPIFMRTLAKILSSRQAQKPHPPGRPILRLTAPLKSFPIAPFSIFFLRPPAIRSRIAGTANICAYSPVSF
eukprot:2209921-Rhodomonas_salina.1